MTIKFFINKSPNEAAVKELVNEIAYEGYFRNRTSFMDLEIAIETEDQAALSKFNYCYIEDLGRFYFIKDFKTLNNKLLEISLKIDVLSTYWEQIQGNNALIEKNELQYNLYIKDPEIPLQQNTDYARYVFTNSPFSYSEETGWPGKTIVVAQGCFLGAIWGGVD